jgi:hypothetical protein
MIAADAPVGLRMAATIVVTCAVYMGISVLLFFGVIALAHLKGSIFYDLNWRTLGLHFALIWLASFTAAWCIVISPLAAS